MSSDMRRICIAHRPWPCTCDRWAIATTKISAYQSRALQPKLHICHRENSARFDTIRYSVFFPKAVLAFQAMVSTISVGDRYKHANQRRMLAHSAPTGAAFPQMEFRVDFVPQSFTP